MFEICPEHPLDAPVVEHLLDNVFGADRFTKASYAIRDNQSPLHDLSFIVRADEGVIGTIRFWPIHIVDMLQNMSETAVLLGPLAVAPEARGQNVGAALMWHALHQAEQAGHRRIMLVGDQSYYGQFGFRSTLPSYISLPGGRDARRLLVRQSGMLTSLPAVGRIEPFSADLACPDEQMLVAAE